MARNDDVIIPRHVGEASEISYGAYGAPPAADFGPLARDRIPVRSMTVGDLRSLVAIDCRIIGHERVKYFERKLADALTGSDVCVSLVAELDDVPVGFVMARVDPVPRRRARVGPRPGPPDLVAGATGDRVAAMARSVASAAK